MYKDKEYLRKYWLYFNKLSKPLSFRIIKVAKKKKERKKMKNASSVFQKIKSQGKF